MGKRRGCSCQDALVNSDFMLLDHHPSCKNFDAGRELYKLEDQAMHFFYEMKKYKDLYHEEKKHREEVEKILTQYTKVS